MRAVVALAVVAACGTAPKRIGTQPSWRHGGETAKVGPVTFAPSSQPATRYNEPVQAPAASPLGDAVLAAVRAAATRANVPAPVADARLFRACAELADVVSENGVVDYGLVEFALQRNGILEPSPHLIVVWVDLSQVDQIVKELESGIAETLVDGTAARVGVGAAKRTPDGTGAVVFALQGSGIATSPIARSVGPGGRFPIDAVVDARFHDPELFVTHDDGTTERLAIDAGRTGGFKASVACGAHTGRQQIEITASSAGGPTVLANFPVWCAAEPPATLTVKALRDDDGPITSGDAENRLLSLLNRDRQAAGLPALVWDERVAAVAHAYSEEMRKTKLVAHISPTSGSAADRVHAASIKTAVVLENVARAYGIEEAHAGLMNSPGHRANIMSATATHVGIGVVLGDTLGDDSSHRREMFITQVFIRIPPKVDPAQAADVVRQRIDGVRHVGVNARIAAVAQQLAEGLAAGKSRDQMWRIVRKDLDRSATTYARVGSVITAVADLATVDGKELVGDYHPDDIGVGIAQGSHPEIGDGAVWIVVLMAERR